MKKPFSLVAGCLLSMVVFYQWMALAGCANIIPPTGGPKDTLPPVLVNAVPRDSAVNFKGNRITLTFDEFVEVQDQSANLLFSPTPANTPVINAHLREISIKLKDTLEANTTYSINFGNAIRDINEGNIYNNFTYVFSTGPVIDENMFTGKVIMAETGKIDSTLIVVLHKNLEDSAVAKDKPRYIARLDGSGNFLFKHLPKGTFAVYAIPNDFSRHYEDTTKPFAFADQPINTADNAPVTLYAYQLKKVDTTQKVSAKNESANKDKYVRYNTNLETGRLDILKNLQLVFNKKLAVIDTAKMKLTDKDFKPVSSVRWIPDSQNTALSVVYNWPQSAMFNLVIDSTALMDSVGGHIVRNDTIRFLTKSTEEYGSLKIRFNNLDLSRNPVLLLVQNEKIVEQVVLDQRDWYRKLFPPGEYDIRILYDTNKNGKWDAGRFFGVHRQPEVVLHIDSPLQVRSNWDNEKEITLR